MLQKYDGFGSTTFRIISLSSKRRKKLNILVSLKVHPAFGCSLIPGKKPKPEVDLEELKKLLEELGKGGDADAKIEKGPGGDDGWQSLFLFFFLF